MQSHLKELAIAAIRDSFHILSSEHDLSPNNAHVTEMLTHLVRTLTQCLSPDISKFLLAVPELEEARQKLPELCGIAECEMEKYWSQKLAAQPACNLSTFWYFPEYTALCEAELGLLRERRFDRISFLGSGALPLTGFILARHCPDSKIICVDMDSEASDMAERLARKVGLGKQVEMQVMNALDYKPQENELVICASLLQGHAAVYRNIEQANSAMIVRDCEGAYQYLYKPATLPGSDSFIQHAKTMIDSMRINTSRYYEPVRKYAF